jgi:hypothetical protein
MTTKTRTAPTAALIVATFALVGIMTTGAMVPAAFAQTATDDPLTSTGGLLDQFLEVDGQTDSNSNGGGNSDGGGSISDATETEEETTTQTEDQSESNVQANSIDQDQTAAVNEEIASGEASEVASAAQSDSESEYESKYKSKSKDGRSTTSLPGTSTATSDSDSDVSNNGTIGQVQSLTSPVQVNTNNAGDDESRSALVGFDLGFEQFSTQESSVPGVGTSLPIIIPQSP